MNHIVLIAEGGINANGHLDWALEMCDQAKGAGCDAIKWQKRTPELSTPEHMKSQPREWEGEQITYLDYRRKVEFGKKEYDAIAIHCKSIGIGFSVSVWDEPSVEFIAQYDVPWIKIPSAKLSDHSLIRKAQSLGLPLVVSTGMSTEQEIEDAIPHIEYITGASLFHTTSTYPCDDTEINLGYMNHLREYGFPVGFSSHADSPYPAIIAGAMGATAIEQHFTLSRSLPGTDQAASLEYKGMALLRRELDRIPIVLGNGVKEVYASELPSRKKLRGY